MALAKGIGGGFPMGAVLATENAASGMTPGTHGTTFGGNPLAMAVGNAVLDVMLEEGFLAKVERIGKLLKDRLEQLVAANPQVFEEVRGAGLMLGLKAVPLNTEIVAALREEGLLTVGAAENVIRILPPLIIGEAEVDEALGDLERVCARFSKTSPGGAA
jgi:acetylornithine/N-succinyldiaminopimelate aminotransferase